MQMQKIVAGLVFCCLCAKASAAAPTAAQIASSRATGLAWLFKNQQGDGSWKSADGLRMQATTAALDAFTNAGIYTGPSYGAGMSYVINANPASTDGRSRQLRTLFKGGGVVIERFQRELQGRATAFGNWGTYPGHGINIADTALASAILIDSNPNYQNAGAVACYITATQASNGGWAYLPGYAATASNAAAAAIIPTVYAIAATKRLLKFGTSVGCAGKTYQFSSVMDSGVAFLKTKLKSDGGFGEAANSTILETALAYAAIGAVNPNDASLANAQGYLISKQNGTNGSWGNDAFLTGLALQTLPLTTLVSTAKDGVPDVVKQVFSLPVGTPYRDFKPGNGLGVPGQNSPTVLAQANQYRPFSYSMSGSGGTAPYNFSVASGLLPEGLSLASSGAITGTPLSSGLFSFSLLQKDSSGRGTYITAQIQVNPSDSASDTDTPTLPEWGAILMGGLLMGTMIRKQRQMRAP